MRDRTESCLSSVLNGCRRAGVQSGPAAGETGLQGRIRYCVGTSRIAAPPPGASHRL